MPHKFQLKTRPWLMKVLLLFTFLGASCPMDCGSGAPSDTQIATALIRDFKTLEKASLGCTKGRAKEYPHRGQAQSGKPWGL